MHHFLKAFAYANSLNHCHQHNWISLTLPWWWRGRDFNAVLKYRPGIFLVHLILLIFPQILYTLHQVSHMVYYFRLGSHSSSLEFWYLADLGKQLTATGWMCSCMESSSPRTIRSSLVVLIVQLWRKPAFIHSAHLNLWGELLEIL